MKIKRYIDKDSRSALARVRAEMGADAVILSNRSVNGQVELVAARDFDEAALEHRISATPADSGATDPGALGQLQLELEKLRGLVEGELHRMAWQDSAGRSSTRSTVYRRLSSLGISKSLCGSVVDQLAPEADLGDAWSAALQQLTYRLSVAEDDLEGGGNIVALFGSTGVGKTTTIAKLAARYMLRHGGRQLALVTTDCYRIGGQEQLNTFASYLGIPMTVATDAQALKDALDQYADRKLVLIDTAGMSQRDVKLHEQFATLNSVGHNIDSYVVLSATAQRASLDEVIRVFGRDTLTGAIVTKLDEATSLGGVLDTAIRNSLKLTYFGTGQKVPEDLVPARADYLVRMAVDRLEETERTTPDGHPGQVTTQSVAV